MKVEEAVLDSPSLIALRVSACRRKATLNYNVSELRGCVEVDVCAPRP